VWRHVYLYDVGGKTKIVDLSDQGKEFAMKKVPFVAAFWTFALAVPFTILALAGVSYVDFHFSEFGQAISSFEQAMSSNGAGLVSEIWARFPEILGMVIGMIVIFTIYIFVRQSAQLVDEKKK
jgi:hypothetical protein